MKTKTEIVVEFDRLTRFIANYSESAKKGCVLSQHIVVAAKHKLEGIAWVLQGVFNYETEIEELKEDVRFYTKMASENEKIYTSYMEIVENYKNMLVVKHDF